MKVIDSINVLVRDEAASWEKILALRSMFDPALPSNIPLTNKRIALERGIGIIRQSLLRLHELDAILPKIEPGHGVGHITRDYINSLRLMTAIEADPREILVGLAGGVFHDIGTAFVHRYDDGKRVVRHAEVAALALLQQVFPGIETEVGNGEALAIAYSVAAHTHYTRSFKIACSDGVERDVTPYTDLDQSGNFVPWVWFPRWIDRLECCGVTFIGRHYLTRWQDHQDYNGKDFFSEVHENYMIPILRPREEQLATKSQRMIEHLHMFASSQSSESVYGKHDYGAMIGLRDSHKAQLFEIIAATEKGHGFGHEEMLRIQDAWNLFLGVNIEHSPLGLEAAFKLEDMFWNLDLATRQHWSAGFLKAMKLYLVWSEEVLAFLDSVSPAWLKLEPIADDVRDVIRPDKRWTDLISDL